MTNSRRAREMNASNQAMPNSAITILINDDPHAFRFSWHDPAHFASVATVLCAVDNAVGSFAGAVYGACGEASAAPELETPEKLAAAAIEFWKAQTTRAGQGLCRGRIFFIKLGDDSFFIDRRPVPQRIFTRRVPVSDARISKPDAA